jgi:hypothetical protein
LLQFCTFSWAVFTDGYCCVDFEVADSREKPRRYVEPEFDGFLRVREPLVERPGLFREFANLPLTEEGILSFADEWGQLLTSPDLGDEADEEESGEEGLITSATSSTWQQPGDTTDQWLNQIKTMNALVCVWDLILTGDEAGLAGVMKAERIGELETVGVDFTEVPYPHRPCFVNHEDMPGLHRRLRSGHLREFAKLGLYDFVNRHFENQCSPWIGPDRETGSPVIRLTPQNLQAALWLQFADAIAGEKHRRQCRQCKRYFEVSEPGEGRRSRRDKAWCSDACRAAAYRERREEAVGLHRQGKTVHEIARQIGVEEKSVRAWIKPRRKTK